jgi:hypothetical protein
MEATPIPLPMPGVLQADRPDLKAELAARDDAGKVHLLEQEFEKACEYGQVLWHDVDELRHYLLASVPPDPRLPGPRRIGASPTGPDDEDGWKYWMAAYAEATSVLAGPHGDSGFGAHEARREAQIRRTAPEILLLAKRGLHPPSSG